MKVNLSRAVLPQEVDINPINIYVSLFIRGLVFLWFCYSVLYAKSRYQIYSDISDSSDLLSFSSIAAKARPHGPIFMKPIMKRPIKAPLAF